MRQYNQTFLSEWTFYVGNSQWSPFLFKCVSFRSVSTLERESSNPASPPKTLRAVAQRSTQPGLGLPMWYIVTAGGQPTGRGRSQLLVSVQRNLARTTEAEPGVPHLERTGFYFHRRAAQTANEST